MSDTTGVKRGLRGWLDLRLLTAASASILIVACLTALAGAWLLGAASYRNLWFPLGLYREARGVRVGPDLTYFNDVKRKAVVSCPERNDPRTLSVLALGQSVGSNRAMRDEKPFSARKGAINFLAGQCYQASDPLLGGDGGGTGNSLWTICPSQSDYRRHPETTLRTKNLPE